MGQLILFVLAGFGLIFLVLAQLRELLRQIQLFLIQWRSTWGKDGRDGGGDN